MKRIVGGAVMAALVLASCGGEKESARTQVVAPKVTAPVEEVKMAMVPLRVQASGTVEARTRSVIAAQVMGVVQQVRVETGQSVQAGQVLVVIDSQQLAAGAAQAEAGKMEAQSALVETGAAIEAAQTQVKLARTTQTRLATLFERKSLSQQEMDEANARLAQAEAALAMARAKRSQVEARIAQAEQGVAAARTQKAYATLVSPFAGVVTEKVTQVGALAVPGAPLLTIERAGGFRAALQVDEKSAAGIRTGMPLQVSVEQMEPVAVRVTEIVPSLDAATRSLTIKADLPALSNLRSGAFARGEWSTGEKEMLSVPARAVRENGQLQMVFVLDGRIARSRMVSVGAETSGRREVLSGLKAGERVVAELTDAIADGVEVEVRQ